MASIGRNDPCPCGSGKKYKACCLDRDEAQRRGAPEPEMDETLSLRSKLISEMMDFAEQGHKRVLKQARQAFPALDDFGEEGEEVEPLDEEEELEWTERWMNGVMFDIPASADGEVVAEAYLRRSEARLSDDEKAWLQQMIESPLTAFEVGEVQPGVGFSLIRLWDGKDEFISEPGVTDEFRPGDVIAARVTREGNQSVVEGGSYLFPEGASAVLETDTQKYLEEHGAASFGDLDRAQRRLFAIVLHGAWTEMVLDADGESGGERG